MLIRDISQTCVGELTATEERKAFQLVYSKAERHDSSDSLVLSVGSIHYIHMPQFLQDLGRSVNLFQGTQLVFLTFNF